MKVITLSKKRFEQLKTLPLDRSIYNTEGKIFDFEYKRKRKIIKRLYHTNGERFANKLYTIEMLNSKQEHLPQNFYIPDYLLSVNNQIEGFTVPYAEGENLLKILQNQKISPQEQKHYLKQIGFLLEQLHNIRKYTHVKDIFIGDLHEANFIVNPKNRELYTLDLDSCKIGNNLPFAARYLTEKSIISNVTKYQKNPEEESEAFIIPDENTDIYCYIIVIMNYLFGKNISQISIEEFYNYINYLEYIGVDKKLLDIFEKILSGAHNENPVHLLDTLTENIVYRSKENIYKLNKGKC